MRSFTVDIHLDAAVPDLAIDLIDGFTKILPAFFTPLRPVSLRRSVDVNHNSLRNAGRCVGLIDRTCRNRQAEE